MRIQRFDNAFLKDFFQPEMVITSAIADEAEIVAPEPVIPVFSEAEIEAAKSSGKKEGYNEGFAAGHAEAIAQQASRDSEVTQAIAQMAATMQEMQIAYQQMLEAQQQEVTELALMMARKIAGDSLQQNAMPMFEAMTLQCLPSLFNKPELTIEIHQDLLAQAQLKLGDLLSAQGFAGKLQIRASSRLDNYDIRIDWGLGHAERKIGAIWQELENLIQNFKIAADPKQE